MLETVELVKTFGLRPVLRGVDVRVGPGAFLALFGPNGAGKTTLLRILATLSRPTTGQVIVAGWQLPKQARAARGLLGVVLHQPLLHDDLSAEENLRFYAHMYAMSSEAREARIQEVIRMVGLHRRSRDLVRAFSRGMQQRLAIARAILHNPPILLLDEPYTGLDQEAAATLDAILREAATHGCTVLMTTHDVQRGLALADRVAILSHGQIAYQADSSSLDAASFAATYTDVTGTVGIR